YLTSKPSWFGDRPWPPIDPASPATAVPTNLPAGYRYTFGVDPPTGPANQPPVAVVSASSRSVTTNQSVNFSADRSYDPEGVALSYSWNFGDGSTSTLANPSHAYSTNGTFNVQLNLSDGVNTTSTNLT